MIHSTAQAVRRKLALVLAAFACLSLAAGAAQAATYVDNSLPDLKPEERAAIAQPQPVQLLFEFRTRGTVNQRATTQVKKWVVTTAQASGLFSTIGDEVTPNGALLVVTIDNVPAEGENAAGKGFVTGLTFGLKGSMVSDLYNCTVEYAPSAGAPRASKTLHHALYTTIGIATAPENGAKAKNIGEAVETMVRQSVAHGLNDLAKDSAFGALSTPTPVPAAPAADTPAPVPMPVPAATPDAAAQPKPAS